MISTLIIAAITIIIITLTGKGQSVFQNSLISALFSFFKKTCPVLGMKIISRKLEPPNILTSISSFSIARECNSSSMFLIEQSTYLNPSIQAQLWPFISLHSGSMPWHLQSGIEHCNRDAGSQDSLHNSRLVRDENL